jgi:hypothetical protein
LVFIGCWSGDGCPNFALLRLARGPAPSSQGHSFTQIYCRCCFTSTVPVRQSVQCDHRKAPAHCGTKYGVDQGQQFRQISLAEISG